MEILKTVVDRDVPPVSRKKTKKDFQFSQGVHIYLLHMLTVILVPVCAAGDNADR